MLRVFVALPAILLALAPAASQASIRPLPASVQQQLKDGGFWHRGCPVALSNLRLLTVTHRDFRGRDQTGQLIVNKTAAPALQRVFRKLHKLRFPIRHLRLADAYGPVRERPRDGDVSGSFECRRAVPSPCPGAGGTRSWSNHAYGLAVDLNPVENPYVGCGQTRDPKTQALPRSLAPPARHGHPAGDQGLRLDRLGLGRRLDRQHEGLHALLGQRTLSRASDVAPALRVRRPPAAMIQRCA